MMEYRTLRNGQKISTIAGAIKGRREQVVMQNHLCVAYPDGNYRHFILRRLRRKDV